MRIGYFVSYVQREALCYASISHVPSAVDRRMRASAANGAEQVRDRLYRTEAVILRRSDFGEADRVITIYTPGYGKRRVVAKGVRKTSSKLAGHLELFTHSALMLARGRNLDVITQSHVLQSFNSLRREPRRLFCGYYAIELLDRLTEEDDPNRQMFELLAQALAAIDSSRSPDLALRSYELHLLGYAGYRPHLYHCAACHNALTEETAHFSPAAGGALCPSCASSDRGASGMGLSAFKLLRYLQSQPIEAAERLMISGETAAEAELLLRAYLRRVLERELKSAVFLDAVRDQLGGQGVYDGLRR
jgi:DNA repair protein RecO (recombination protein O)